MPGLLPAVGPIYNGGFVQLRVDAAQGGKINNGPETSRLPDRHGIENPPEILRFGQKMDALEPHICQNVVDDPETWRQKCHHHAGNNHHRNEVRQVADSLHGALEPLDSDFIEQKGFKKYPALFL